MYSILGIKEGQKELSRHHFYVQVNPYPKSQQNDFGSEIYNPLHKNYLPDGSGTDEHELPSVENTDLEGNQTSQANPLRYRPAHYVPFKVPLYDEQYSQIQQDVYSDLKEQGKATSADKPDPLYRWYYRPELQFSQYNFDAKSLIVNQIDDEGEESITEINIEDEGTDFGPIFDDYTDSVELLFDLLGPQLDRLPALENDREFVLSLGGEEAIATIGADGKVTFENPEHLNRLNSEDLLSLRLYLNGDAGNILWEYQIAGFSSFWSIYPNQQPEQIRNAVSVERAVAQIIGYPETSPLDWLMPKAYAEPLDINLKDGQEYYFLGGMRVKLLFQAEKNSTLGKPISITWSTKSSSSGPLASSDSGEFYADNKPATRKLANPYPTSAMTVPNRYLYEIYFQPETWSSKHNIEITAQVRYENSPLPKSYTFTLKSRELFAVTATKTNPYNSENLQAPLEGADVAMLEGLLWQLGYGPNFKNKGSLSVRKKVSDLYTFDTGCATGTDGCSAKHAKGSQLDGNTVMDTTATMEMMVWRYKYANEHGTYETSGSNADTYTVKQTIVDQTMLDTLKNHYNDYRKAIFANEGGIDYTTVPHASNRYPGSARFSVWLDSAVTQWAPYYSEQTMTDLMGGFATQYHTKTRQNLLSGWVSKESNREHWGSSKAKDNYRMIMGSADSRGSFGFHQIQARYLYGKDVGGRNSKASGATNRSKCSAFTNDNTYKPASAVIAVTKWSIGSGCGGSMRQANKADNTSDYEKNYNNTTKDINLRKSSYSIKVGSSYEDNTFLRTETFEEKRKSYERLIKGIAGYNQGASDKIWKSYSIPEALLELESNIDSKDRFSCIVSGSASDKSLQTKFCNGLAYAINVRKKEGLPLVKYVYEYEFNDFNSITNVETGLLEQGPALTKYACFEYGEAAWLAGNEWETLRDTQVNEIKCTGKALEACTNQAESSACATLLGGS